MYFPRSVCWAASRIKKLQSHPLGGCHGPKIFQLSVGWLVSWSVVVLSVIISLKGGENYTSAPMSALACFDMILIVCRVIMARVGGDQDAPPRTPLLEEGAGPQFLVVSYDYITAIIIMQKLLFKKIDINWNDDY